MFEVRFDLLESAGVLLITLYPHLSSPKYMCCTCYQNNREHHHLQMDLLEYLIQTWPKFHHVEIHNMYKGTPT